MSDDKRGGSAFSWFLAGLGLGSLIGVLYAPKPGQETRDDIVANALGGTEYVRQRSREAKRTAGDYVARGRDQATDYVSTGREHISHYVNRSREAVEASRQKINDAYSQSLQTVAEQKEKLAAAYDAGRQAYIETTAPDLPREELIPSSEKLS